MYTEVSEEPDASVTKAQYLSEYTASQPIKALSTSKQTFKTYLMHHEADTFETSITFKVYPETLPFLLMRISVTKQLAPEQS
jgi:hypothetical protein